MSARGEHLKDKGSKKQTIIAGGAAGLISRFCIAPLDVIKIRLQLQSYALHPLRANLRGTIPIINTIFRNEGIRGFWRGNVPAELLYVTYGAAQFSTYRILSTLQDSAPLPFLASPFVSGAIAGAAATTLTYPLDLIRTRFAAQGTSRVYTNLLGSIFAIARTEGAQGFFKGLKAGVGQVMPYMGILFGVYESLRPRMQDLKLPFGSGDAAAGVMASAVAKTSVFPLDLIRKRLQVQGPARQMFADGLVPEYGTGVWITGRRIVGTEGWRGLYRGLGISLVKAAPASAVTMWTYERVIKLLVDRDTV